MTIYYAPTAIDLSRLPAPQAIEALSTAGLLQDFISRFLVFWDEQRLVDPTLPAFDEQGLQTNPAIITGRAWTYLRLLDRQRVNDGLRALLAPLATGPNLDVIAASRNIVRITIIPASANAPAVLESDANLLGRYLRSFDKAAAGSADRYLYEAWRIWPQNNDRSLGLWDAKVNAFDVHGRRGDIDIVIIGPFGRTPSDEERLLVRSAVTAPHVKPNATSVAVLAANRAEYAINLVVEVPPGPDPGFIVSEAVSRVRAAATERTLIGGEIPPLLLSGAAFGPSVIKVRDLAPVAIAPDPYAVPVLTSLKIEPEVRA